jgi:signal transduction histidine kinase
MFVEVDLNTILGSILSDLELLIDEKKAVISTDRLPVIQGIPLQLQQLFLNLVSNSLKFTERPPEINITSEIVKAKEVPSNLALNGAAEYLLITLSDNGIGFDQKFEDKIFSIFQRLHHERNIPGTGIGLALCKKIVENHQGRITVKSRVNEGTKFFIYLPYAATASRPQRQPADAKRES